MEQFLSFLQLSKQFLSQYRNVAATKWENVHVVLGNESCDLDSMCSSLLLGYLHLKKNEKFEKSTTVVLPIMNTTKDNFLLRTDNCFLAKNAGICLDNLIFRNEICFRSLIDKFTLIVTLVDHHILSKHDDILTDYVVEIFDHRPLDVNHKWNSAKVKINIENVGSCCTLIGKEFFNNNDGVNLLTPPLTYLLYQPILFDTVALKTSPNGRATSLDLQIGEKLEAICGITKDNRQHLFDKLWTVHNDVSHLTPYQILFKDLKIIEGVYIPGLPMLVENYVKIPESLEAIEKFAENHKVNLVLLVGLEHANSITKRDIGLYSKKTNDKLKESLLNVFEANDNEYDFQFEKREQKIENIHLLHVHNTELSRKALAVLVKIAWANYCKNNL